MNEEVKKNAIVVNAKEKSASTGSHIEDSHELWED